MVPIPNRGASSHPPSNAPAIPITTFRNKPCCASVFMSRLASQPIMPPTTIQIRKFIFISFLNTDSKDHVYATRLTAQFFLCYRTATEYAVGKREEKKRCECTLEMPMQHLRTIAYEQ